MRHTNIVNKKSISNKNDKYETIYVTEKVKARRWGIGITAGYGIGRDGLSPYVGIGGYYRIW